MADRAAIIERIKALRAKADNVAATEAEALAAAELAAKLLSKHEVAADELRDKQETEGVVGGFRQGKELHPVLRRVWSGIVLLTETEAYNDQGEMCFIGVDSDVEMAIYLSEMLVATAKRAWLGHAEENPRLAKGGMKEYRLHRESYFAGFGDAVLTKMKELHRQRGQNRGQSESTAVVVVKKDIIKRIKEEKGLVLHKRRQKGPRVDPRTYGAGRERGDKVNVGRPFAGTQSNGRIGA